MQILSIIIYINGLGPRQGWKFLVSRRNYVKFCFSQIQSWVSIGILKEDENLFYPCNGKCNSIGSS